MSIPVCESWYLEGQGRAEEALFGGINVIGLGIGKSYSKHGNGNPVLG